MSYQVIPSPLSFNRSHCTLKPVGMALHSTDTPGATAIQEVKYFNTHPERQASAHGFIDWTSIMQTIPFKEIAWHAGHTANSHFIGIELCEPAGIDPVKFKAVWDRAVWWFADTFINTLKIHVVTKDNLMSHAEISAKWHETNHTDPVQYFKKYGKTIDQFRSAVQAEINKQLKGGK